MANLDINGSEIHEMEVIGECQSELSGAVISLPLSAVSNSASSDEQPGMIIGKCGVTQIVNIPIQLPNGEFRWQTVQLTAVEPITSLYTTENQNGQQVLLIEDTVEEEDEEEEGNELMESVDNVSAGNLSRNCQEKCISGEKRRREVCSCPNCKDKCRNRKALKKPPNDSEQSQQNSTSETSEKPPALNKKRVVIHVCPVAGCTKTFQKTSHLKSHIRTHSGDRPYQCTWEGCSRAFTRSDQLGRHLRTHSGEQRFTCESCAKFFTRRDHYVKHINARHSAKSSS